MKYVTLTILTMLIWTGFSFAQLDDSDDLLFFEDYEELVVVTASKKSQTINEAPAIISVITTEDIQHLGIQTLPDLMRYVPGFVVEDVYWRGPIVTARGVAMTLYNDKILMLIDGIPAYETVTLEYYLDTVPISAVKKIEIVRGPGSTLYGTNAFSAVINIITRSGEDLEGGQVTAKYGSFNTRSIHYAVGRTQSEIDYFLAASLTDNDGYNHTLAHDESGVENINLNYENDIQNIFGKVTYKGFKLSAGYYFQNIAKFSMTTNIAHGSDQVPDAGLAEHRKAYVNATFLTALSDRFEYELNLHYDDMDKETGVGQFGATNFAHAILGDDTYPVDLTEIDPSFAAPNYSLYKGRLFNGETRLTYHLDDNHRFLAGLNAELRDCDNVYTMLGERDGRIIPTHEGSTEFPPDNVFDLGGYIQADGKLTEKLGYIAGARLSHLGISEKTYLTPRGGLVYNFSKDLSAKLLYGEAFRGPGFQEQFFLVHGVTYGADAANRKLEPERITTIEAAIDISLTRRTIVRINGFLINTKELILRRTVAGSADTTVVGHDVGYIYDNFGKQKITGLELEVKGRPNKLWQFFANISLRQGRDEDLDQNLMYFVRTTATAGLTYKPIERLRLSPNCQFIGPQDGELTNGTPVEIDGYFLLNGVIHYRLLDQVEISLAGLNLTDEDYEYPERVRRQIPTLPGGPGRSFYAAVNLGW